MRRGRKNWKKKLKRANYETLEGKRILTTGRNIRGIRGLQNKRPIPTDLMRLVQKNKGEQK